MEGLAVKKPSRDTIDISVRAGRERRARVDLGLAVLEVLLKPGQTLTRDDIAAWCGVSQEAIRRIEGNALRKLANSVRFGSRRNHF